MPVVNVKYENLQDWLYEDNHFYIGPANVFKLPDGQMFPSMPSVFTSSFEIGKDGNREEVLAKYEEELRMKIMFEPHFRWMLMSLKGQTLGCFCKPAKCHGDVIFKLIKEFNK